MVTLTVIRWKIDDDGFHSNTITLMNDDCWLWKCWKSTMLPFESEKQVTDEYRFEAD